MFKKILFVSLVVLFSTTLIPKEKVFLDYAFLKDISERLDKACEMNKKGKTVKAERALKELQKEIKNYFLKLGTFSLSKNCSLVLNNNDINRGDLECLPHINIFWGTEINNEIKERIEFSSDKNIFFVTGEFKIYSIIKNTEMYSREISPYYCSSSEKKQEIQIYASPLSVTKEQDKKWSSFQGNMTWNEARTKCESLGMRLPTENELLFAPKDIWDKEEKNIEEANTEIDPLDSEGHYTYSSSINSSPDEEGYQPQKYSVRCIAGKEFQFKKIK